jgi:hypothetical protein
MKSKKCKYCRSEFVPYSSLQKNCLNTDCVKAWIDEVKAKQWAKKKAQLKKDLMTVQDYIKIAQQVFNQYIRMRDKDELCISCQREPLKKNAGHYMNANNHWAVRFDERNVNLQCEHCNTYLSGNLINYRENLIKKIGVDELADLEQKSKETRKYTIDELKEIITTYKKKIKELEK